MFTKDRIKIVFEETHARRKCILQNRSGFRFPFKIIPAIESRKKDDKI